MITKEEVKRLAYLARLEFSEDELDGIIKDMDEIIAFANTVNDSVEGDAEDVFNSSATCVPSSSLRDDVVKPSLSKEKILSNSPSSNGMFSVKRGI